MYSNYQLPPKMFADLIGYYPRNAWPYPHPVLWKLAQDKKAGLIGKGIDYYRQFEENHPRASTVFRFTPIVSTVPTAIDILRDIQEKKYAQALLRLGAFWVPFGPEIASALKLAPSVAAKISPQQPTTAKFSPWRPFIDFWGWIRGLK
jgi:hypothetical protein